MDNLWLWIVAAVERGAHLLDAALAPLHVLGPAAEIAILALLTVCFTKLFSRFYTPRRYRELQATFHRWYRLRQEALECGDPEKGRLLAKNIDQAQLNKAYYDYFFEGLLKGVLTTYLPVLVMAAYVNESYRTENLVKTFGRDHVLRLGEAGGEPLVVGGLFWFVLALLFTYAAWFLAGRLRARRRGTPSEAPPPDPGGDPSPRRFPSEDE